MAQVSHFHYDLPVELIAQQPLADRSASRMLVVFRKDGTFKDDQFCNLASYIRPGDCLVLNNTRVLPARLRGRRNRLTGAEVEVFLVRALQEDELEWQALVRPGKRVRAGDRILFSPDLQCEVLTQGDFGERRIRFHSSQPISTAIDELGEIPLPPYIHRAAQDADRERYQTVFAQKRGSVAAPTAGLHFTPEILAACRRAGATTAQLTLHVGLGTFAPLRQQNLDAVQLHQERFEINSEEAQTMRAAERLFCIGTTSVRTVESACLRGGLQEMSGETSLFIQPGFLFRATGAMLTNFHLPESSLLMLVSAFGGRELMISAYRHAVEQRYRFFSYGDCMLIV